MNDRHLLNKIDAFVAGNSAALVRDIASLVAVRSVAGSGAPGAPFGAGPRQALDTALAIAARMGLATCDGDGYVGWAALAGAEQGYLATITHVDTVAEGEGWAGDPLVLRQQDGWLIGRGVADDKGPCILCLYAAKFLKQLAQPLRYGLRLLIGCDEESDMGDVGYYLAHHEEPLFCFSPDGDFPVCNGEKGVCTGTLVSPLLTGALTQFCGGIAGNTVPQQAFCVVRTQKNLPKTKRVISTAAGPGLVRLDAAGVGSHAASPSGTVNAIGLLVDYLLENQLCIGTEADFLRLLQKLHSATDGSCLGIACTDPSGIFTPLTCVGGTIALQNGTLRQGLDVRYPTATNGAAITAALATGAAAHGATYVSESDAPPFYISAESEAIATLLTAYTDVTGRLAAPFTMGGGTYARLFKNAVSFGPGQPGAPRPAFAGPEHAANEGVQLAALLNALKIYILALCRLQLLDFEDNSRPN